jgi:hypothetical protein
VESEQQDEQGSHQRPSADARHSDQRADEKARQGIKRIVRRKDRSPPRSPAQRHENAPLWPVGGRCFAEAADIGKSAAEVEPPTRLLFAADSN